MKWNEILMLWLLTQVGNLMSLIFGTNIETVFANLYFSGTFALFLAGIEYFRGAKKWKLK